MELKQVDDSKATPRHKQRSSLDDHYNTPDDLYYALIDHYDITPELDPFTEVWTVNNVTKSNSKCIYYFTEEDNAFEQEWLLPDGKRPTGVWINNPHSLHKETLEKCLEQWRKHDLDILFIIPANTCRPNYWYEYVQQYLNKGLIIEPLIDYSKTKKSGYINFQKGDKGTKYNSRNGYLIIRYYSKKSWTRFLKKRAEESNTY